MRHTCLRVFTVLVLMGCGPQVGRETGTTSDEASRALYHALWQKQDLLGPLHYDERVTVQGFQQQGWSQRLIKREVTQSTIWEKGLYARKETTDPSGKRTLTILHPDTEYHYDAARDVFVKMQKPHRTRESHWKGAKESSANLRIRGTGVIAGKDTIVIEDRVSSPITTGTSTIWVWKDTGFLLKEKMRVSVGAGLTVVATSEREHIVFGDVPDTLFEVPQEKITEVTTPESAVVHSSVNDDELAKVGIRFTLPPGWKRHPVTPDHIYFAATDDRAFIWFHVPLAFDQHLYQVAVAEVRARKKPLVEEERTLAGSPCHVFVIQEIRNGQFVKAKNYLCWDGHHFYTFAYGAYLDDFERHWPAFEEALQTLQFVEAGH